MPTSDSANWLQSLVACPVGQEPRAGRYSQYYMIFIMVAFFSFMMLMLHDIATPDKGFWKLDREPFENLVRDLDADYGEAILTADTEPPGTSAAVRRSG